MGSGNKGLYSGTRGSSQPYAPTYSVMPDMQKKDIKEGIYDENRGYPHNPSAIELFSSKKNKAGTIYSVTYHDKRGCFRYMVDYGDRKSTCWYFDEDLQKQEQTL